MQPFVHALKIHISLLQIMLRVVWRHIHSHTYILSSIQLGSVKWGSFEEICYLHVFLCVCCVTTMQFFIVFGFINEFMAFCTEYLKRMTVKTLTFEFQDLLTYRMAYRRFISWEFPIKTLIREGPTVWFIVAKNIFNYVTQVCTGCLTSSSVILHTNLQFFILLTLVLKSNERLIKAWWKYTKNYA